MTLAGNFKRISKKGKYLYNVKKLSLVFRGKMMEQLKKQIKARNQLSQYQSTIDKAWVKKWVVFCEPSFGNAEHIIKYLGQYTHRVAISNHRLQNIDDNSVSFYYKDYRNNGENKPTTLPGVEFLRRFCMHILPKGFVKIRYYGIVSSRYAKKTILLRVKKTERPKEKESVQERLKRVTGFDIYQCPFCKKGQMHTVKVLPRIRSPGKFLQPKAKNLII